MLLPFHEDLGRSRRECISVSCKVCYSSYSRQHHVQQVQVVLKAPSSGWLALNTDGAVKNEIGLPGCGGVLHDAHGVWLSGFSKRLFATTAYLAELWGILEGIRLAIKKGLTSLEILIDSSTIVNCLNGNDVGRTATFERNSTVHDCGNLQHLYYSHISGGQ